MTTPEGRPDKAPSAVISEGRPLRVQSEALLGQAQELVIVHNGREYRLRRTQSGKLILTA